MKSALAVCFIVSHSLLPYSLSGQASFHLANYDPPLVNAPVFDGQGVPLAGADYLAELWGSPTSNSLAPLVVINEGNRRLMAPFISGGYFVSGSSYLSVPTVNPYSFAWLQVRAWDSRVGATYEEVAALGLGGYGESPLFYTQGNDPLRIPPDLAAPLVGLQSFSLRPVPEPSTGALLALGGLGLCAVAPRHQWARIQGDSGCQ